MREKEPPKNWRGREEEGRGRKRREDGYAYNKKEGDKIKINGNKKKWRPDKKRRIGKALSSSSSGRKKIWTRAGAGQSVPIV